MTHGAPRGVRATAATTAEPSYKWLIYMTRKSQSAHPGPGRRPGLKAGLGAGRNPQLPGQRRKALAKHYRAKFQAGRSGRR